MDISTIIGIIAGFGLIILSINNKGEISNFFDLSSVLIVLGGTVSACFVSYPMDKLKDIVKIIRNAFNNKKYDIEGTIEQLCKLSLIAKKEGLLAMEKFIEEIDSEFMKKGVLLLIDGTEPVKTRKILEYEVENMLDRHNEGESILLTLGKYSPAFGMIGTLIGLINMLKKLNEVSTLGTSMGIALITTFYGSLLANVVFLPLAGKLRYKSENEARYRYMVIEGIMSIQSGESPLMIKEKLETFMEEKSRKKKENIE